MSKASHIFLASLRKKLLRGDLKMREWRELGAEEKPDTNILRWGRHSYTIYELHEFCKLSLILNFFWSLKTKEQIIAPICKELRSHHFCLCNINNKSWTNWRAMTFLGLIKKWGCRANYHPGIWRDRFIQRDTTKINISGVETTGSMN